MPYRSDLDPRLYRQWDRERAYTVRQSVHNWTVYRPVDVTLATPGTAQNLYRITSDLPTTNFVTNPSFEVDTTGWTAVGSVIATSAVQARNGTNSLLIDPANTVAGEGAFFLLGGWPGKDLESRSTPLAISAYFRSTAIAGGGIDARIEIRNDVGTLIRAGNTVAIDNTQWLRSTVILAPNDVAPRQTAQIRIYGVTVTQHNTNFYMDSVQAESYDFVSDYADGSLGLEHFWRGTVNASESFRRRSIGLITGYRLFTTRDIYVVFDDYTASSTTGEFIRAGTDFHSEHPVAITRRINFVNAIAGETPRIFGSLWGTPDVENS